MSDSTHSNIVYPRCKRNMRAIYISAEGYVYPCCWIGNEPYANEYKIFHSEQLVGLNVLNREIKDIIADPNFKKIEATWNTRNPFAPCLVFCAKPIPENSASVEGKNDIIVINTAGS